MELNPLKLQFWNEIFDITFKIFLFTIIIVAIMSFIFPSVKGLNGYTMQYNFTYEGQTIGIYNNSYVGWAIATTGCKQGNDCLTFPNNGVRFGDYAYIQNSTFLNARNRSFIMQGWLNPANVGGNEQTCLMYDITAGGTGQPPSGQNYSTACIAVTVGGLFRLGTIQTGTVNQTTATYNTNAYYWVVLNVTSNGASLYAYTDDTKSTLILGNNNMPNDFGSSFGYVGFASVDGSNWDGIEYYTPTVVIPVNDSISLNTNFVNNTFTTNNNITIGYNATFIGDAGNNLFHCELFNYSTSLNFNEGVNLSVTNYFTLDTNNSELLFNNLNMDCHTHNATKYPTTLNMQRGTLLSGSLQNLTQIDNVSLVISESNGQIGLNFTMNITNVTNFDAIHLVSRYNDITHNVSFSLMNFSNMQYLEIFQISDGGLYHTYTYDAIKDTDFINNSRIKVRIFDSANGNANDNISIDYLVAVEESLNGITGGYKYLIDNVKPTISTGFINNTNFFLLDNIIGGFTFQDTFINKYFVYYYDNAGDLVNNYTATNLFLTGNSFTNTTTRTATILGFNYSIVLNITDITNNSIQETYFYNILQNSLSVNLTTLENLTRQNNEANNMNWLIIMVVAFFIIGIMTKIFALWGISGIGFGFIAFYHIQNMVTPYDTYLAVIFIILGILTFLAGAILQFMQMFPQEEELIKYKY